ncbi:MAG: lipocalin family protein [Bacteroidia bacterium]
MILSNVYRFSILVFVVAIVWACQRDPHHMITQKWQMVDNELTLDIRADSSYIAIENKGKPQTGTWRISEDTKSITFKQKNNPVVSMDIITLSEEKLVLNNNGEEMVFTVNGEPVNSDQ